MNSLFDGFNWAKEPPSEIGTYWLRHPQGQSTPTLFAIMTIGDVLPMSHAGKPDVVVMMSGTNAIQQLDVLRYLAMQGAEFSQRLDVQHKTHSMTLHIDTAPIRAYIDEQLRNVTALLPPLHETVVTSGVMTANDVIEPPQGIAWAGVPKWDTAPAWALWWAMNEDGRAWWHENEPVHGARFWIARGNRYVDQSYGDVEMQTDWANSLQARPMTTVADSPAVQVDETQLRGGAIPQPRSWDGAPDWANWWAADANGQACWYSHEPILSSPDDAWDHVDCTAWSFDAHAANGDWSRWSESLTARPITVAMTGEKTPWVD